MPNTPPPSGLDEFLAENLAQPSAQSADLSAPPAGLDAFIAPEMKEEKYGTVGQQLKTAAEGLAKGIAGPLATAAEVGLGIATPEDIRAREEVNPGVHLASEVVGLAAPALATAGASTLGRLGLAGAAKAAPIIAEAGKFTQAGLLGAAGQSAAKAVGLGGKGASYVSQIGAEAVKGAFESALFQGGDEISKLFTEDPEQTAESAAVDIGLATLMGGVFGGALGAALKRPGAKVVEGLGPQTAGTSILEESKVIGAKALDEALAPAFVSEVDQVALEAGDFATAVRNSNLIKDAEKDGILAGLGKEKKNAKEIREATNRLGGEVLEGMVSEHELVQRADDALIHSGSIPGLKRKERYDATYGKATNALDQALGAESQATKAQVGNELRERLITKLEAGKAQQEALYSALKEGNEVIAVGSDVSAQLATSLKSIKEARVSPSSPEGQAVRRALREAKNVKTIDDLRTLKGTFTTETMARPEEKRLMSIIRGKFDEIEETAIEAAAKRVAKDSPEQAERLLGLIEQKKTAGASYKAFMKDVEDLFEPLGRTAHGPQHAIQILRDELTAEQIAQRLFAKNNSAALSFFQKKFPEEMAILRQYAKSEMREAASKTGELSPKVLFNNVNRLEPEIQKALFSKEELQKLRDAETVIRAFPKNYNPSGTAYTADLLESFTKPTASLLANARDLAIDKFIRAVGAAPEVKNAVSLAKATVQGEKLATKATKSVFDGTKGSMPAAVIPMESHRGKLDKLVSEYQQNPDKMLTLGDNNPVPEYGQAFAQTTARAVSYLSTLKPDNNPKLPLDAKVKPNAFQVAAYNRALDTAQQPLIVLNRIKEGTLTPQDLVTVKTIYPKLYDRLSQRLTDQIIDQMSKGQQIPYKTRLGLALFLGQPLDSTMTPEAIVAAQTKSTGAQPETATQPGSKPKHSMNALTKMSDQYKTPDQRAQGGRVGKR